MDNIIFISVGVVIVLIFLGSVSVMHIRAMRDDINARWYNLADKLQYRQDLIPNLVETIRLHAPENAKTEYERIIEEVIQTRSNAGKNSAPGSDKISSEHALSKSTNQLLDLSIGNPELSQNTNFLELKKELKDISHEIETMSSEYNEKVRHHNRSVGKFYNAIPALIMRYSKKKIFEFE